jgi:hypothetical protein
VLQALGVLNEHYRSFDWERGSADGYADAIEGALNLYQREPVPSTAEWIDSEIEVMWQMQDYNERRGAAWRGSGIIEGWHGDGNFARTTLMYCLWKTQGLYIEPWREDIELGAVSQDGQVFLSLSADEDWFGRLVADRARHRVDLKLPYDWPRINQFPEWFAPAAGDLFHVHDVMEGTVSSYAGATLHQGIPIAVKGGASVRWVIESD